MHASAQRVSLVTWAKTHGERRKPLLLSKGDKQMAIARKTTKTAVAKESKTKNTKLLDDQPLELLSPQEYEAITAANYHHPESRIILRLFMHVNYFWHISRHMQGLPSSVTAVDWQKIEQTSGQLIRNTFQKLMPGVKTSEWDESIPEKYQKV